jgi:hypothetical protein
MAAAELLPVDACPVCQPGIPDAALPLSSEDANGGRVTDHQCASCGTAWSTFWDRHGWPIERLIAPVSPEQAAEHREVLERALKRTNRRAA